MSKYGIPYQGSKSGIADWVINNLPRAEVLVDMFAGGCAVTHAAMLSGKWERIIANDINKAPALFQAAINGEYRNERRWISREEFFRLKDSDPYIALCWSFGNNTSAYLYGRNIEPYKKSVHELIFAETPKGRRMKYRTVVKELIKYLKDYKLKSLQNLQSLESLERLQSLESLERLERLQISQQDYRAVEIPVNAVVYCDIPYIKTECTAYKGFDHAAFYSWLDALPCLAVISEITAPPNTVCVAGKEKSVLMPAKGDSGKRIEKLFVHENFLDEYRTRMSKPAEMDLFTEYNRR